ncbi:MAG: serine hydrolase domain-containing protein [Hyphomonadaceae bacterium]
MTKTVSIEGTCASRFARVRDAFAANFSQHGEVGAAFSVVLDGEVVADLWGGSADKAGTSPWRRETLTNVWSTTKGVAALCFAMLVDRGKCRYEDPVARYWPEFAANGKERVTIAQMISHQAGLCGFAEPVTMQIIYDQPRAEALLAAQAPFWTPGEQSGYHAVTVGILNNALFRRIEGRTLAAFVREEISVPYGLDIFVGLPDAEAHRASEIIAPPTLSSTDANPVPSRAQQAALANPVLDPLWSNTRPWRLSPIPSVNGFANASSLAQLYGAMARGGELKGRRLLGPAAIATASTQLIEGPDAVLGLHARWAAGFLLNVHDIYGDRPTAYGHSGWGGSFAFADPDRRLGVSYVMNAMGHNLVGDPRGMALIKATLDSCA